jgi:hypothetical protein
MGYYVQIMESDAYVPADKIEAACRGIEPMMQPEHVAEHGQGGSWEGGNYKEVWYSWIDTQTCIDLLADNDLAGFIEHWGFYTDTDADGDIYIGGYDSKTGQEEYMLQNLAPFIASGTSIKWRGEDGNMWADFFENGKMFEKSAKIVWE